MNFIDRAEEMARLVRLAARPEGGLAVVYGRRRLGKTLCIRSPIGLQRTFSVDTLRKL